MGKGSSREVYDFLMSLDYGICHGPLDAVNQVWVKDKRIFCGQANTRVDLPIKLPDLFGGDNAEGGVDGTVEVYTGTDDQLASDALAARNGRTPSNHPGYRGLAHLFFRGRSSGGFAWSSNNPYLPVAKASVTRCPQGPSADYRAIYPFYGYASDGTPQGYNDFMGLNPAVWTGFQGVGADFFGAYGSTVTVDLTDPAIVPGGIVNAGDGVVRVRMTGTAQFNSGGAASGGQLATTIRAYNSVGAEVGSRSEVVTGTGAISLDVSWPIPNTATSVSIQTIRNLVFPFFASWTASNRILDITPATPLESPYDFESGAHCTVDDSGLNRLPNANPAYIIYECLTNAEWGKGESPSNIDTDSFLSAAGVLYRELFGLYVIWTRQTEIESFIQEILDHIQAFMFINPRTGLWTLKLLRADYDASTAPRLDETNCRMLDRKRMAWGETVNEIVVEWTDPVTEEKATVSAHNLGNIAVQGGVNSETRSYYGIRDPWLAQFVADRDVVAAGYPVFTAKLAVNRSEWDITPGEVRRLSWAEDGLVDMVVRVTAIDYGEPTDREITLEVVEDIFSIEQTAYGNPQRSEWVTDRAVAGAFAREAAITAPLPVLLRNGFTVEEVDAEYPGVGVLLLGGDVTGQVIDFQAHTDVLLGTGGTGIASVATAAPVRFATLTGVWVPEVSTTVAAALIDTLFLGYQEPGDLLMVGTAEDAHEIVMLDVFDSGAGTWTVIRGLYDTVPAAWAVGTPIWEFPDGGSRLEPTVRAAGESLTYRFLPRTSNGRLAYDDADDVDLAVSARPHLPFRPADTQIEGSGFGVYDTDGSGIPASVEVTWANRNRTTEDTVATRWDGANVTPEPGQTTVLRIIDVAGVVQNEIDGLTGTSYTLVAADFAGVARGSIEFVSERDGLRSRPGARRGFDFSATGYGLGYGLSYGRV